MLTRVIWVFVFALVTGILVCAFLPSWALKLGFILAEICFIVLMLHVEMCFLIRIGRLESLDTVARVAYFTDIGSNDVFTHHYDIEGEDLLKERKKYLVADYGIFSMFAAVDEYEWGAVE